MKKSKRRKRLIILFMVLVIGAAAAILSSRLNISGNGGQGGLHWDILAAEGLLLAGGYGLALAAGGEGRKCLRKDVSSHVG